LRAAVKATTFSQTYCLLSRHSALTGFGRTHDITASVTLNAAPTTPITFVATETTGATNPFVSVRVFKFKSLVDWAEFVRTEAFYPAFIAAEAA
jgi:hypothetical protein